MDLLGLFEQGTAWTTSKIAGAKDQLDVTTPCDEWCVRVLINHLLAVQQMFAAAPSGGTVAAPGGAPPELVSGDPAAQYDEARKATLDAYSRPGVLEGTVKGSQGDVPATQILGIAFTDALVHGWDLAKATGQDATMPAGLASAAFGLMNGRIPEHVRGPGLSFKPAVAVPDDASDQDKLLAYLGRNPA